MRPAAGAPPALPAMAMEVQQQQQHEVQLLLTQLPVELTEDDLAAAFTECGAPLLAVFLTSVPVGQERWCLGYALCTTTQAAVGSGILERLPATLEEQVRAHGAARVRAPPPCMHACMHA